MCYIFFDTRSFGLKLLNIVLERNPSLLATVQKLNLIPVFFEFFQLDNTNNNITNIKLIKKVVESSHVDKKLVFQYGMTYMKWCAFRLTKGAGPNLQMAESESGCNKGIRVPAWPTFKSCLFILGKLGQKIPASFANCLLF